MPSPHDFRLQDGTVIDHLPVGTSARALVILGLPREGPVTVGMNVPSARFGQKDIIRVEGLALRKSETDRLALLGENVTVAIVKGGKVASKQRLEVPERLVGVIRCQNPTCVTNHERVAPVFDRVSKNPLRLRCAYCERASADPYVFVGA
ncbi:MAG: aspartate carbamoyltransferase regulatory subunit [Planctomycetia bacterium]|nr:aspartate carbamoyltransferase regulatory subunit [Planctomycetia bacterium]